MGDCSPNPLRIDAPARHSAIGTNLHTFMGRKQVPPRSKSARLLIKHLSSSLKLPYLLARENIENGWRTTLCDYQAARVSQTGEILGMY